jgi:hypothetical protein
MSTFRFGKRWCHCVKRTGYEAFEKDAQMKARMENILAIKTEELK